MVTIDRLDAEILAHMTKDARVGIAELALSVGVSRNTVQARIHRLEDAGILLGFRPIVDLAAIGMPVQAVVSLDIDQRRMSTIIEGLESLPQVLEVRIQAGSEDLSVAVAIESLEALQKLTAAIVELDGVRKTTSSFAVATPIPYRVQPLLDQLTKSRGRGRSTPSQSDKRTSGRPRLT